MATTSQRTQGRVDLLCAEVWLGMRSEARVALIEDFKKGDDENRYTGINPAEWGSTSDFGVLPTRVKDDLLLAYDRMSRTFDVATQRRIRASL